VKALVLGHTDLSALLTGPKALELLAQRDIAFAALANMARAEEKIETAQQSFFGALNGHGKTIVRIARPSQGLMETYVEHLIEEVGAL
jgi:hypothetical protein